MAKILETLKALEKKISLLTIIVVVPPENVSKFQLGKIEGNTPAIKKLWKKQDCDN